MLITKCSRSGVVILVQANLLLTEGLTQLLLSTLGTRLSTLCVLVVISRYNATSASKRVGGSDLLSQTHLQNRRRRSGLE